MIPFVEKMGEVEYRDHSGKTYLVPVFPGFLKHLQASELMQILESRNNIDAYLRETLRIAPWQILRQFPHALLEEQLALSKMSDSRRKALEFIFSALRERQSGNF